MQGLEKAVLDCAPKLVTIRFRSGKTFAQEGDLSGVVRLVLANVEALAIIVGRPPRPVFVRGQKPGVVAFAEFSQAPRLAPAKRKAGLVMRTRSEGTTGRLVIGILRLALAIARDGAQNDNRGFRRRKRDARGLRQRKGKLGWL